MTRSRAIALTGVAAGLLVNYWVLEGLLADRTDPSGSWISDLGSRTESTRWIFGLMDAGSGLLICLLAILLWEPLAARGRAFRWGLIALVAVGLSSIVDGFFPLSCAETLQPGCNLGYDAVDVVHATENVVAVIVTAGMFWLLGSGFRADSRYARLGTMTLACGAAWLLLTVIMGSQFVIPGMDEVKGLFQRASQVVLGLWLAWIGVGVGVVLAGAARAGPNPAQSEEPGAR